MIRNEGTSIFLGAVVQPKTKSPVWVQRKAHTFRTVNVLVPGASSNGIYVIEGEGYLDGGDMGAEYLNATKVSGFPRAHTPEGVRSEGRGFGTCLYTGLVLLATAIEDDEIYPGVVRFPGSGYGICSDEDTRKRAASDWWEAAVNRDLAQQESGSVDGSDNTSTETVEDVDLSDYVPSRRWSAVLNEVSDAVHEYSDGWSPSDIRIRGDLEREVPGEDAEVTADYYTLDSAEKHKLVVVRETREGMLMEWGKDPNIVADAYYKDVILALNVVDQSPILVGKLAAGARAAGATEAEVTAMIMRNRYGIDLLNRSVGSVGVEHTGEYFGRLRGRALHLQKTGVRGPDASGIMVTNPRRGRRSPPTHEPPPPPMEKNPPPVPTGSTRTEIERDLERLERRRDDLGWNKLEDLP